MAKFSSMMRANSSTPVRKTAYSKSVTTEGGTMAKGVVSKRNPKFGGAVKKTALFAKRK